MHATEHGVITLIVKTDRFIYPCMYFSIEQKTSLINKTNVVSHVAYIYLSDEEPIPANTSQKLNYIVYFHRDSYRNALRT